MKASEFSKQALTGKPLLVVEYREMQVDEVRRKVQKVGEAATMPLIKHKVLVGNESWEIGEFLADGVDVKAVKQPYAMRDLVVVEVETMEKSKWGARMQAKFHGKLEQG